MLIVEFLVWLLIYSRDVQMETEEPNLIMIYLDGMKEWEIQKYMNERIKKGWMNEWAIDMN